MVSFTEMQILSLKLLFASLVVIHPLYFISLSKNDCYTSTHVSRFRSFFNHLASFSYLCLLFVQGMPFRTSHEIVGRSVALCVAKNCQLSDLTLDQLRSINPIFEEDVYEYLGVESSVKKFCSYGSTGSERVAEQLNFWVTRLHINQTQV